MSDRYCGTCGMLEDGHRQWCNRSGKPAEIKTEGLRELESQLAAAVAERDALTAELGMFREMVGVRADTKASASDINHWIRLIDRADSAVRLQSEVEAEKTRYVLLDALAKHQISEVERLTNLVQELRIELRWDVGKRILAGDIPEEK